MKENVIRDKSLQFAIRMVKLANFLREEKREYVLSKQIVRSGTAIGALVREARYGESTNDFLHKLTIALKEAGETEYWIELLFRTDYISKEEYNSVINDIHEIIKILTAITKTIKSSR
ncbi:MAG: four helix bundle protein [Ignavibacteriales bacterium]|nr:MAG: four helix bundle protein [Ignavibacteriales bacterium]